MNIVDFYLETTNTDDYTDRYLKHMDLNLEKNKLSLLPVSRRLSLQGFIQFYAVRSPEKKSFYAMVSFWTYLSDSFKF